MSIEGFIVMGCILAIFATFAVVLAWGAHQTKLAHCDSDRKACLVGSAAPDLTHEKQHARAA